MNIEEEFVRVKYLENNRRQSQQSRMELRLYRKMDSECQDIFVVNAHRDVGASNIAELGENIVIRRFVCYLVSQPLPSEGSD